MSHNYVPTYETADLLDRAMEHIRSVPYKVSLRWVFYRLLQDGEMHSKADYDRLAGFASKARKSFWGSWRPDTLVDSGRSIVTSDEPTTWNEALDELPQYVQIYPKLYEGQKYVPFLLFEAATMDGQFRHFAPWADRAALKGDASVPHKWNIAKRIEYLEELYDLPVYVLYFGDYDEKGLQIPESAMFDVYPWAKTKQEVLYRRCGISPEQADQYGIPEKPGFKHTYEWEALSNEDAGEIITTNLHKIIDIEKLNQKLIDAEKETDELRAKIETALQEVYRRD